MNFSHIQVCKDEMLEILYLHNYDFRRSKLKNKMYIIRRKKI